MKLRILIAICAMVLFAGVSRGQTVDNTRVTGVWRAQMGDLPVFTLVVTDEGGGLSGAIVFYMLRRDTPNQKPASTPGNPEPILHPVFDGKTLTFQVSHRRAHPPRTLTDPPITMSLTPPEQGKAGVMNWEGGQSITLTRSDY